MQGERLKLIFSGRRTCAHTQEQFYCPDIALGSEGTQFCANKFIRWSCEKWKFHSVIIQNTCRTIQIKWKITSETPGNVLVTSTDPSISFVCTALDHSEFAFKCSSCQILPATQSTLSLFASQWSQWPIAFSKPSIAQRFISFTGSFFTQKSEILLTNRNYFSFATMDSKDFIALSIVISLHTHI